ncbi:MAG: chemotaxis protein CheX [Campylobacterota bacterium]|nr:chemotaxis protein CheX [Campylobacterota bacterium]
MKLNDEILEKLAVRTIAYIKNNLKMDDISDIYEINNVEDILYLDITALIALSGDINGTIGFSVSSDISKEMVQNFIYGGVAEDQIDEFSSEVVSEVLNVTLGNILEDLFVITNGGKVEISTPHIMNNKVSISKKENSEMYLCKLKYNNEDIILSYFI